jgi:hypothetical protein
MTLFKLLSILTLSCFFCCFGMEVIIFDYQVKDKKSLKSLLLKFHTREVSQQTLQKLERYIKQNNPYIKDWGEIPIGLEIKFFVEKKTSNKNTLKELVPYEKLQKNNGRFTLYYSNMRMKSELIAPNSIEATLKTNLGITLFYEDSWESMKKLRLRFGMTYISHKEFPGIKQSLNGEVRTKIELPSTFNFQLAANWQDILHQTNGILLLEHETLYNIEFDTLNAENIARKNSILSVGLAGEYIFKLLLQSKLYLSWSLLIFNKTKLISPKKSKNVDNSISGNKIKLGYTAYLKKNLFLSLFHSRYSFKDNLLNYKIKKLEIRLGINF